MTSERMDIHGLASVPIGKVVNASPACLAFPTDKLLGADYSSCIRKGSKGEVDICARRVEASQFGCVHWLG